MEIRDRQKFLLSFGQPVSARHGLAFWAAATLARVIQDDAVPAVVLLDVPTQHRCTAVADVPPGLLLSRREPASPRRQKVGLVCAEDTGQPQPILVHRFGTMV